ncbi:hypothetical protein ACP4OV_031762 [Aristida adscensionis]
MEKAEEMTILESLVGEIIAHVKGNWRSQARVDQRRRRLRQLVAMVCAVADAAEGRGRAAVHGSSHSAWLRELRAGERRGQAVLDAAASKNNASVVVAGGSSSSRRFLAGLKALLPCSSELDQLKEAVEELEHIARPGGDLRLLLEMLRLDAPPVAAASSSVPGVKRRKRILRSRVLDDGLVPDIQIQEDSVARQDLHLAWMDTHQQFPDLSGTFAAPSTEPAVAPPSSSSRCRRARALALALAMAKDLYGRLWHGNGWD